MDIKSISDYLSVMQPDAFTQENFERAAGLVNGMKNLDQEAKLQLYGLYKQSLKGDVRDKRPWLDMVGQAKWDAWKQFEGMSKENAGLAYIYIVDNFLGTNNTTSNSNNDNDNLGLGSNGAGVFTGMGVSVSTQEELGDDSRPWDSAGNIIEALFEAINNEDMIKFTKCLDSSDKLNNNKKVDINVTDDESEMTALHYAVDRGVKKAVEILIKRGADVNLQDTDGMTPIMYAAICDHIEIIQLLKEAHADLTLRNTDDETVFDMDMDASTKEILSL